MKKRDKFVICAMVAIVLYTAITLCLSAFGKQVPDSLTVAWFSAWTVELALLAGITIKDKGE